METVSRTLRELRNVFMITQFQYHQVTFMPVTKKRTYEDFKSLLKAHIANDMDISFLEITIVCSC